MRRAIVVGAGGVLGDYVPFNFCPRSVMLYAIHQGRVQGYDGGQGNVVHLVSSTEIVAGTGARFVFTDRHAEPPEAEYFTDLTDLDQLPWDISESSTWGGNKRRPFKQAEFLVRDQFPWTGVREIGVMTPMIRARVEEMVAKAQHEPEVQVHPEWYY